MVAQSSAPTAYGVMQDALVFYGTDPQGNPVQIKVSNKIIADAQYLQRCMFSTPPANGRARRPMDATTPAATTQEA